MLDRTDDISIATENWLAQFETALANSDHSLLQALFHPDSYWRDALALSWNLQTINGADAILSALKGRAVSAAPGSFRIDPDRAAPRGEAYSRDFRGPNWLDLRKADAEYADRDPAVLVIGGGQSGLSIAARLKQLGVDTLIVDRELRIGDNWRKRYHALTLHNQVQVNHLPYMLFPPNWPTYIPKDKLA